jgi:hypothetical protein
MVIDIGTVVGLLLQLNQVHLLEYFVGAYKLCKKGSWSYKPIGHSNPTPATTSQKWQLQQWKATLSNPIGEKTNYT